MRTTRYSMLYYSGGESRLPLFARGLELGLEVLVEGGLVADFGEEGILARGEELLHRLRGGDDLLDLDRVEEALLHAEENRHLHLDRHRAVGRLLEQLDDAR